MLNLFRMSDLGLLSYYLGNEVHQHSDGIDVNQSVYALKILENSGMAGCNPCQVPMENQLKLSKKSLSPPVNATKYRKVVGILRYLTHTRPDITYDVGYVSRFMEEPREEHYYAVKHILRYIAGTVNMGCRFKKKEGREGVLIGYSDSDLGGDLDDRKCTTCVLFFFGENPVTWQS